jgi:hypothetical protein
MPISQRDENDPEQNIEDDTQMLIPENITVNLGLLQILAN